MKDEPTILPDTIRVIANITRFMSLVIAENNRQSKDTSRLSSYYAEILACGLRFYLQKICAQLGSHEADEAPPLRCDPFESDSPFIRFINKAPDVDHLQAMISFYDTASTYLRLSNHVLNKDMEPLAETASVLDKIKYLDSQIIVGENTFAIKRGLKIIAGAAICVAAACLLLSWPIEIAVAAVAVTLIAGSTHLIMPDSPEVCAENIIAATEDGTGKLFRLSRSDTSAYPPDPDSTPAYEYAGHIFTPFAPFGMF